MSVFTNPASRAGDDASAYVTAVLGLVGDRDPVSILRETPDALARAIAGLDVQTLRRPEREGKWSIAEVLRHLADAEIVWAWRMRLILAQERPTITGYDQDLWADRLRYRDADPSESLEEFRVLRRGNLRLVEGATPADLARAGVHVERGEETLDRLHRLYAGHDLLHLNQIARIRAAAGG